MTGFARDQLEQLSRRRLQALAKQNDIKGNLKSSDIIDLLMNIRSIDDKEETDRDEGNQQNTAEVAELALVPSSAVPSQKQIASVATDDQRKPEQAPYKPPEVTEASYDVKSPIKDQTESVNPAENIQIYSAIDSSDTPAEENICDSDEQHSLIPYSDQVSAQGTSTAVASQNQIESESIDDDRKGEKADVEQMAQFVDDTVDMPINEAKGAAEANALGEIQIQAAVRSNSIVVQDAINSYRKIAMESRAVINGVPLPTSEVVTGEARKPEKPPAKVPPSSTKSQKRKFDLQESLSRPIAWEMKKGPLPPVSGSALEDPNRICLWSPMRTNERKTQFKNNEFGGTKKRLNDYFSEGHAKTTEKIREHRRPVSPPNTTIAGP